MYKYPLASSSWGLEEIEALQEVIKSGKYSMGERVNLFESQFAKYFGSKFAIMCNSGSSANLLAISALKYSSFAENAQKNEIIVPTVSWSTTYYPVQQLGFKLRFVDIDLNTLNIDIKKIESKINSKTLAIFAVNLLGNPAPLKELRNLCEKYSLTLLEDNCESMGAEIDGKSTGTVGLMGTFSFFFSHHISTMEGGMVLTNNEEIYHIARSLRAHGWIRDLPDDNPLFKKVGEKFKDSFTFILPGYNLRPLEFSAAAGIVQLKKFDSFLCERRKNLEYFRSKLSKDEHYILQLENGKSSSFGFSIILNDNRMESRDKVIETLNQSGIETRPIVTGNFTRNPVMKYLDWNVGDKNQSYPVADKVHEFGFFVGNHHFDLTEEIDHLVNILNKTKV